MESEEYLSLHSLLLHGYGPDVLATAIENHGLHCWDRFGRYGAIKGDSVDAEHALAALARIHDAQVCTEPFAEPWDQGIDHTSIISRYGWMQSVLPNLDAIQNGIVKVSRPQSVAKYENNSTMLIGALLDYIEFGLHSKPHPEFKNIQTLVDEIEAAADSRNGLGHKTTKPRMLTAREQFRQQFPKPLRLN